MPESREASTSLHSENCASLKVIPAPCNCPAMTVGEDRDRDEANQVLTTILSQGKEPPRLKARYTLTSGRFGNKCEGCGTYVGSGGTHTCEQYQ